MGTHAGMHRIPAELADTASSLVLNSTPKNFSQGMAEKRGRSILTPLRVCQRRRLVCDDCEMDSHSKAVQWPRVMGSAARAPAALLVALASCDPRRLVPVCELHRMHDTCAPCGACTTRSAGTRRPVARCAAEVSGSDCWSSPRSADSLCRFVYACVCMHHRCTQVYTTTTGIECAWFHPQTMMHTPSSWAPTDRDRRSPRSPT
jgi:hypothetical protein